jgi:hypothetical protein
MDIAVLRLEDAMPDWIELHALCDYFPQPRDRLESFGFSEVRPEFGDPAAADVVGVTRDPSAGLEVLELRSAELTQGYSGAPLVDPETGCTIAVVTSTLTPDSRGRFAQHVWAVPVGQLYALRHLVDLQAHPLVAELHRLATERTPTILDFALDRRVAELLMPPRLREKPKADGTEALRVTDSGCLGISEALEHRQSTRSGLWLLEGVTGSGKSVLLRAALAPMLARRGVPGGAVTVPIYVRAQVLTGGGSLPTRVVHALQGSTALRFPHAALERHLRALMEARNYEFVVLVDGLDEIVDRSARSELAKDLAEAAEELARQGHWMVVTTKPVEESVPLETARCNPFTWIIEPSAPEDLKRYFTDAAGSASAQLASRFERLSGAGGTAGHPLLAALAVTLYIERKTLWTSVLDLFDGYITLIARRLQSRLGQSPAQAHEMVTLLGVLAHESLVTPNFDEPAAVAAIGSEQCRALVGADAALSRAMLEMIVEAQIALYREDGILRWTHLSIRDFLAGTYLASVACSPTWKSAMTNSGDASWRTAVEFALVALSRIRPLGVSELEQLAPFSGLQISDAEVDLLTAVMLTGGRLGDEALCDFVDAVTIAGINALGQFDVCASLFRDFRHPIDQLLRLQALIPRAQDRLIEILQNTRLPRERREHLAKALCGRRIDLSA